MAATPSRQPLDERFFRFVALTETLTDQLDLLVDINEAAMEHAERQTRELAQSAIRSSISLMILAISITIVLSYLLSTRISKPLRMLTSNLSRIKEGSGDYPTLPVVGNDEIGFLTMEFNRLFDRLKVYDRMNFEMLNAEKMKVRQAEEAKTRFIADLSHQLKTPMTSLSMSVGPVGRHSGFEP